MGVKNVYVTPLPDESHFDLFKTFSFLFTAYLQHETCFDVFNNRYVHLYFYEIDSARVSIFVEKLINSTATFSKCLINAPNDLNFGTLLFILADS